MRSHRLLGIALHMGLGLLCASAAQAQTQTAAPPAPPIQLTPPEPSVKITPTAPGSGRFDIKMEDVSMSTMIEELARAAGKKVLISDEVRAHTHRFSCDFHDTALRDVMELLAHMQTGQLSIAWGTLGPDTWLVVARAVPKAASAANVTPPAPATPPAQPTPKFNGPPYPVPHFNHPYPPQPAPPDKMPPGTYGFDFNGQRVYVVPLDK